MKKGTVKSIAAMACVAVIGVVPVFASVVSNNLSTSISSSISSSTSVSRLLGDINNDGQVGLDDATTTLKAALNIVQLSDEEAAVADINGDGEVELNDATLSLKLALNISVE